MKKTLQRTPRPKRGIIKRIDRTTGAIARKHSKKIGSLFTKIPPQAAKTYGVLKMLHEKSYDARATEIAVKISSPNFGAQGVDSLEIAKQINLIKQRTKQLRDYDKTTIGDKYLLELRMELLDMLNASGIKVKAMLFENTVIGIEHALMIKYRQLQRTSKATK